METDPLRDNSAAESPTSQGRRCLSEVAIHRIGSYNDKDFNCRSSRKMSAPNPGNENSVPLLDTHELNSSLMARKGIGGSDDLKSVDDAASIKSSEGGGTAGRKKLRKRSFIQSLRLKSSSVISNIRSQYVKYITNYNVAVIVVLHVVV